MKDTACGTALGLQGHLETLKRSLSVFLPDLTALFAPLILLDLGHSMVLSRMCSLKRGKLKSKLQAEKGDLDFVVGKERTSHG